MRPRHKTLHPRSCWPLAPIRHGKQLYRARQKIEIMFGRLKDWRRIATRYDRCAHTFMSAIALAATVLFWLPRL
jgi:transposase